MQAKVVARQLQRMSHIDLPEHAPVVAVVVISEIRSWGGARGKLGERMGKAHVPTLLESRKERSKNISMNQCL